MRTRLFCLALAAFAAASLSATTYTVTNTNDSGAGSLRQAIMDANTNVGADTIAFNIPGSDPHCDAGGVCRAGPEDPAQQADDEKVSEPNHWRSLA